MKILMMILMLATFSMAYNWQIEESKEKSLNRIAAALERIATSLEKIEKIEKQEAAQKKFDRPLKAEPTNEEALKTGLEACTEQCWYLPLNSQIKPCIVKCIKSY